MGSVINSIVQIYEMIWKNEANGLIKLFSDM